MKKHKLHWIRYPIYYTLYFFLTFVVYCFGYDLIALAMIILFFFKVVRYAVSHFDLLLRSMVVNTVNFFRYKQYNSPEDYIGSIDCYCSHTRKVFGCCKTLSGAALARQLYRKFNGKESFEFKCKHPHWVKWDVRILSNFEVDDIPVIPLSSMQQLVDISEMDNDGVFWCIVIDEANAWFNSRNFKDNFQNEEQIRSIVTCRHNNMTLALTGQRFKRIDALIRDMSDRVIECEHFSFVNTVKHHIYSAYDLENCDNPRLLKRIGLRYFYAFPEDYTCYDTKALVAKIAREPSVSSAELAARRNHVPGLENVRNLSRKGTKLLKKK